MLWQDTDKKKSIETKVIEAADYYSKKYGENANICFLNPQDLEEEGRINELQLRQDKKILAGHLWIGVEDKKLL